MTVIGADVLGGPPEIERAHRSLGPRPGDTDAAKPRYKFLRFQEKEKVPRLVGSCPASTVSRKTKSKEKEDATMNKINLLVTLVLIVVTVDEVHSRRPSNCPEEMPQDNMCASGDGSNYRGTVSISARGHSCLHWDLFSSWKHYQSSKGLGPHNNCRGNGAVREFCDIRKCEPETELTCGERVERPRFKVVGGLVTPIQSHPWVSAIYQSQHQPVGFLCGGSLITPCWVLTAAHCFAKINIAKLEQLSVYLGKSALNETDVKKEQKFTVEQLVLHSGSAEDQQQRRILRCSDPLDAHRVSAPPFHHPPHGPGMQGGRLRPPKRTGVELFPVSAGGEAEAHLTDPV
ncbi:hypothetical protein NHX12_022353 [Muraenolepis orangiensis]|uniref:trypsin n=1 Tax=Muraenolepis orangiensis TaxID=630683 RepID=A0A9Q0EN61_9TELE|nr:hypothetical protein NHX12_022353 [Muraenolepis orangiensis]